MPRIFRLALAQINLTVGDVQGNTAKILRYVDDARRSEADLVAFPEMAITGYPPEDLLLKKSFVKDNVAAMEQVIAESHGIAVVLGYVHLGDGITNAAAIGYDGKLVDTYHKIFLPNYGVFDEERYFKKGSVCPVYEIDGVKIGVNVCEDIWFRSGPTSVQREAGAELIVNINASPFHAGKSASRHTMIGTRAADNQLFVAYLNTVGGQDELVFDGNSIVCDATGTTVARGPAFEEKLIVTDLNLERDTGDRTGRRRPEWETQAILDRIGAPKSVHISGFQDRERPLLDPPATIVEPEFGEMEEVEEVYHALVMGTRDYLGKTGFTKAMVGLSGGVDSALTVAVAADALGKDNVLGITMPSRYSSEGSISDSKKLAENLGIELWEVPIEPAHRAFADMLDERFRDTQPNVAEENVQARIRGNVLMTISNKYGWMVLTTGNKSEMAMGYATLYGDMAGGFAVLKDVPKTTVYELCRWRNKNGSRFGSSNKIIPQAIIDKPPSAELKDDQLDQDTLPPYEVLDPVIKAYVEDDCSYAEMVDQGFDPEVVRQVITAVDRNEYKRRQAPPGVKITPRAFGRDWRLPIVNRYRQV
jgi:NAD+ synthase (glutamine-hydrolysing)